MSPEQQIRADFERPVMCSRMDVQRWEKLHPGYAAAASAAGRPHGPFLSVPFSRWKALCAQWGDPTRFPADNANRHPVCLHGRRLLAELAVGNEVFVPDAERQARLDACSKCPWLGAPASLPASPICRKAGCKMSSVLAVTTKYATEVCPLGRWPARADAPRRNVFASASDQQARQSICAACEFQSNGVCTKAAADMTPFTSVLVQYVTTNCPSGKWPSLHDSTDPFPPNQAGCEGPCPTVRAGA
jgi:hypothetical protein